MHLLLFEGPAHLSSQFIEKPPDRAIVEIARVLRENLACEMATGSRWLAAAPPESA